MDGEERPAGRHQLNKGRTEIEVVWTDGCQPSQYGKVASQIDGRIPLRAKQIPTLDGTTLPID